ncbi:hypothetical protein [Thalassospira sp. A3_1]|uniref:hypothetical protein n=1 Tax=Thalassospira sp. A3_1 TaxID=2821088 RepID=UPI001ADCEF26|nr:hypothetical protein [Thalassospira sp. A3_1]MBO9509388.1 hypothetical protein [Thalassospira sp. A3_1]
MTKFNVLYIISDHIGTLRTTDGKLSCIDVFLMYVVPGLIGGIAFFDILPIEKSVFGVSISVFAIFSALLLNVQIAIFGIFQRKWILTGDTVVDQKAQKKYDLRKNLLSELNTNISYLILISCFSVTFFLVFYVANLPYFLEAFAGVYLYIHFLITLMMVIKRTHVLFQHEYSMDTDLTD